MTFAAFYNGANDFSELIIARRTKRAKQSKEIVISMIKHICIFGLLNLFSVVSMSVEEVPRRCTYGEVLPYKRKAVQRKGIRFLPNGNEVFKMTNVCTHSFTR